MPPVIGERGANALGSSLAWAVSVALLAFLGNLVDGGLATTPLFLIVGALLGAVGGFLHFLAHVAPELLPWRKKDDSSPRPPP